MLSQIKQDLLPTGSRLAITIRKGQQFFAPAFIRSYDNQQALAVIHPYIAVNTVSPDVDKTLCAQVTFLPSLVILFPALLETGDGGR